MARTTITSSTDPAKIQAKKIAENAAARGIFIPQAQLNKVGAGLPNNADAGIADPNRVGRTDLAKPPAPLAAATPKKPTPRTDLTMPPDQAASMGAFTGNRISNIPTAENPIIETTPKKDGVGALDYNATYSTPEDQAAFDAKAKESIILKQVKKEQLTDDEYKFLIREAMKKPVADTKPYDDAQAKLDAKAKASEDELAAKTESQKTESQRLLEAKKASLDASYAMKASNLRASGEATKGAAQGVLSFSGFGRSTVAADRMVAIEKDTQGALQANDAAKQVELQLFERQLAGDDSEALKPLQARAQTLRAQADEFSAASAIKIAELNAESGVKFTDALENIKKAFPESTGKKVNDGVSKMLGFLADDFGQPIGVGADGKPVPLPKDDKTEWATYDDAYGNKVFYNKANPKEIYNPNAAQSYDGPGGEPATSPTSNLNGVKSLGKGNQYKRDDGTEGFLGENCIKFLRSEVPSVPYGLTTKQDKAQAIKIAEQNGFGGSDATMAQEGDALLTKEGDWGHGVKIISIDPATMTATLREANYAPGQITEGRTISLSDPLILGFISSKGSMNTQVSEDRNEGYTNSISEQVVSSMGGDAGAKQEPKAFTKSQQNEFAFYEKNLKLPPTIKNDAQKAEFLKNYDTFSSQAETAPIKQTDTQRAAEGFANRVKEAESTFGRVAGEISKISTPEFLAYKALPAAMNGAKPAWYQEMEQAQRDFINSVLRRESGAAISPSEFDSAAKQYFPQPGDKPSVLEQKRKNRETTQKNLFMQSGYDEKQIGIKMGAGADQGGGTDADLWSSL